MESRMFICDSPDTVREILEQFQEDTNLKHLLCTLQFGTLPNGLTVKNLGMFATEV